jgi:hypothetical protein
MDGTGEGHLKWLVKFRSPKATFFSPVWKIDLIQIQYYYKKQVMLKGGQ